MAKKEPCQFSDPEVTLRKWQEELDLFKSNQDNWRRKGVVLVKESFPELEFLFLTYKTNPVGIAFAIRINFTNYDTDPLSVKFINPVTGLAIKRADIPFQFIQVRIAEGFDPSSGLPPQVSSLDLLQGLPHMEPFFCIPGILEYHQNPRHSGDSWFLYRKRGEGTLGFILDQLHTYSTAQINSLSINLVVGFQVQPQMN